MAVTAAPAPAERPVFAETNLGTHLAVAIAPDITVGNLKKKLGREHSSCFPYLGEVKVHSLLVKRKLHQYHLPDSMPLWNAFQGSKIAWFLFMHLSTVEQHHGTLHTNRGKNQEGGQCNEENLDTEISRTQSKEEKIVSEDARYGNNGEYSCLVEAPRESFPEGVSVSWIIANYFADLGDPGSFYTSSVAFERENQGESCYSSCGLISKKKRIRGESGFSSGLNSKKRRKRGESCFRSCGLNSKKKSRNGVGNSRFLNAASDKEGTSEVGRRLVSATTKIGLQWGKRVSRAAVFVPRNRKQLVGDQSSPFDASIFDSTDSDG
ncbi:ubiquitin-protein ligase [Wolffia australiana]